MDRAAAVERICERVAEGECVRAACAAEGVKTPTFLRWVGEDDELTDRYGLSLAARAEWYCEEHDRIRKTAVDRDTAAAARVQLQALEWQMQRAAPKRYADRLDLKVSSKLSLSAELEAARLRLERHNAGE